jgi:lysophospholipase L1-like esterase
MKKITAVVVLFMLVSCAEKTRDELVIGCVGDSLMRPMPFHFKKLMRGLERRVEVAGWAQGGMTVRSYLDFYKRRFPRGKTKNPDFVLIQLGTNDVWSLIEGDFTLDEFKADLKEILKEFRTYSNGRGRSSHVLIANVPFRIGEEYGPINRFVKNTLNPSIATIAKEEGLFLVDNYRVLNNRPHLYSADGVHPNRIGERALAQNWIIAIKKVYRISTSHKK